MMTNKALNPFATGLLSAVSIAVVSSYLSNLVHPSKMMVVLKIAFRIQKAPPWQFLAQPPKINSNLLGRISFLPIALWIGYRGWNLKRVYMENQSLIFPYFVNNIRIYGKFSAYIENMHGKFSIYHHCYEYEKR